jgi:hypothetical protein
MPARRRYGGLLSHAVSFLSSQAERPDYFLSRRSWARRAAESMDRVNTFTSPRPLRQLQLVRRVRSFSLPVILRASDKDARRTSTSDVPPNQPTKVRPRHAPQKSRHGLQYGTLVYPTRPDAPSSCAFHFLALSSNPLIFLSSCFTTPSLQTASFRTPFAYCKLQNMSFRTPSAF